MKQLPRITAAVLIILLYVYAKPFSLNANERVSLAKEFHFDIRDIDAPTSEPAVYVRDVHPQYEKISTWISSIGSASALCDYDRDQLQNDIVSVDPRWNKVFISPLPGTGKRFASFELKARKCNMTPSMVATGALVGDFNEDGNEDILVIYFGRSPIIFYSDEKGEYRDEELVDGQRYNTATATLADFNGDGHPDIFLGNYFPDWSNLYDKNATDKDQIMNHSMSRGDNGALNHIYLWSGIENGTARFTAAEGWQQDLPYPDDWTLAVAAADINNDLLPDLYISNDFGPDKLLINTSSGNKISFRELQGAKKFRTTRSNVIGHDSFKGMGADFSDINNDGLLDIYVSNIADNYALHESHFMFVNTGEEGLMEKGIAPYLNQSEPLGLSRSSWGWDSKLADFNNDGIPEAVQATGFVKGDHSRWPELQELATTNDDLLTNTAFWPRLTPGDDISGDAHLPFFVRHASGKYFDLSPELGLDQNQITRGISIGDIDHDGKLDFVSSGQWENSRLYHNQSANTRPFIGLALKFPLTRNISQVVIDNDSMGISRFALGAVARVRFKDGSSLIRYVDGGNGHSGRNSHEIHFSFEESRLKDVDHVELEWRKSDGAIARANVNIQPGWHTLYLPY